MVKRFQKHILKQFPYLIDSNVLIAISGGIDSVVLAQLMQHINCKTAFAHCNFKLRGKESDLDTTFVKNLGSFLQIPVHVKKFDTETYAKAQGISIQMAARTLRYDWFDKVARESNYDYILTAHHKDDHLETFLINLTRGTGLDGLTGIPSKKGKIIRPLLNFSRKEIKEYAVENCIQWREDQSNKSTKYFRNKIRHEVVPVLKELNPSLLSSFEKTVKNLSESQQLIRDHIEGVQLQVFTTLKDGTQTISIEKIKALKSPKANLYELLKPYGFTNWKDISSLLKAQSGKQLISKTHRLIKNRDELLLSSIEKKEDDFFVLKKNTKKIEAPTKLHFKEVAKMGATSENIAYIDKSLLNEPLIVRKYQKGDYFYPIGMHGKKKVSKYFKDEKLSLLEKETTWLLCNGNEIVWIIGRRLDNRYKVTENTQSILKITCSAIPMEVLQK